MEKSKRLLAKRFYKLMRKRAVKVLKNPVRTKKMIDTARHKSEENKGPLTQVWNELQMMFNLVRDWRKGNYTQVPTGSILAIAGAILYFISPIDAIPDFIPIGGYLDDAYILKLVFDQVQSDVQGYRKWKSEQDQTMDDPATENQKDAVFE